MKEKQKSPHRRQNLSHYLKKIEKKNSFRTMTGKKNIAREKPVYGIGRVILRVFRRENG